MKDIMKISSYNFIIVCKINIPQTYLKSVENTTYSEHSVVSVAALQPCRVIQIIQVIWVTFCPGQSGFHPDELICLTRIKIVQLSFALKTANEKIYTL